MSISNPFFTIIVPACNVGKYAREMVESVRAQTYADFECIIGYEDSTDGTLEILQAAVGNDARFSIHTSPRTGSASEPRNFGIRNAKGKYLVFLDGDDWLENNSLQLYADKIAETSADLIITDAQTWICPDGKTPYKLCRNKLLPSGVKLKSGADFLKRSLLANSFRAAVWFYCVRKDVIIKNKIYQPIGRLHQDNVWSYRVCIESESAEMLGEVTCNYRKRPDSVTSFIKTKSVYDMAANANDTILDIERMVNENYSDDKIEAAAYYLTNILNNRFLRQKSFASIQQKDCKSALHSIFPNSDRRKIALHIIKRTKLSRRIGSLLTILGSYPFCFTLAGFLSKFVYEPLRNLTAKIKKL